jgi:GYF domain 2
MRQFSLFIDNEVRGPLSEYDIQDLIQQGSVDAETLCALAGSTEWEPLSNHFTFGSSLKLNRTSSNVKTEEETVAQTNRLDPSLRQKLLMYGLANAATVDQLSQTQGEMAVQAHEEEISSVLRTRKIGGIATFFVVLGLALVLGLTDNFVSHGLGALAKHFAKDDPVIAEKQKRFEVELKRFEDAKIEAAQAIFPKPPGAQNARNILLSRVKVTDGKGYKVSGVVDASPLANQVSKWNIKLDDKLKVYVLPFAIPENIAQKMTDQANVLDIILSPLLSDAAFENLKGEIIRSFPDAPAVPEAARLKTEMEVLKIPEVKNAISRVEFYIRNAEQPTAPQPNKQWATELKAFADKLRDLESRMRINVDPNARKQRWSEFNQGPGAELAAWVLASTAKEIKVAEDGAFLIDETGKIDPANAGQRVLVTVQINGDTLYLPWGSKYLRASDLRSEEIAKDILLVKEKYKVMDKPIVGGKRTWIKFRVGSRDMTYERTSPQWFYFFVAREHETDTICVMVDRETHAKYSTGDVLPFELLSKLEVYPKPTESSIPPPLSLAE